MPTPPALRRFFTAGAPPSNNPDGPQPLPKTGWNSPAARRMFLVGLLVRVLYITLAHTYRFRTTEDHFPFGWEMGRIARALATGRGFSDPFGHNTGPTAWTPPLYPLLMAVCFKLFGVYSNLAAWFLLTVNSVFSAATAVAIFEIADRCYSPRPDGRGVALWSGWLWALYPAALQYAVHWPWDMALTAWFFSMALVVGLRLRGIGYPAQMPNQVTDPAIKPLPWATLGLFWGLIALSNSSLLTFLPIQALWILWPSRHRLLPALSPALLGAVVFLSCITPWILRNQRAFHAFVPLRGNFGAELYESALPSNEGFPYPTVVPLAPHTREFQRYDQMGEYAYNQAQLKRAKALIAGERTQFLKWTLQRVQFYWFGVPHPYDHGVINEAVRELNFAFLSLSGLLGLALSLHRRVPAAGLFAASFAVLPLIYYVVIAEARMRHPIEPLITIFSVYLFRNADRSCLFSFSNHPQPSPHKIHA